MLTDEVCESKWISFLSRKSSIRMIDPQSKVFPKKTKPLHKSQNFPKPDKLIEEEEINPHVKRNSVYKKMSERRKSCFMDEEFEKFKEINQKVERKESNFHIYPCEKSCSVFENLKTDLIKEKHKDVLEMMEIPTKKQQIGPESQLTLNKFISYENFITENESKLKASLQNINPFTFNTKRKRCIYINNFI